MEHGISAYEAGRMPQAKEAHERDEAEDHQTRANMKKGDFLSVFNQNRFKEGGPRGFHDQEEMLAAMNDPAYEKSEEYRQAVAEILSRTPAEVCGVSGAIVTADGQRLEIGRQQKSEVASVESMMENARRDMVLEEMGKMDLTTAKGRFQYMEMLSNPANAEAVAYLEGLVTSDEQVTRTSMLESQAAGHVDRFEMPVTGAIDQPEGTIFKGSKS